jgi:hypothetical protein
MSLTKRVGLAASAAALSLTGASMAGSNEANDQDLRARIDELESKLAKMEAQNGDAWLSEQRATEIRSLIQDVLQDADTRASLLQGGGTAGHDGNFFLSSADGNFRLNLRGQIQARYVYNYLDTDDAESDDRNRSGFEMARTKLVFFGNVVNPDWTYEVEGDFSSRAGGEGSFTLENAWINYDYGNGWGFKVGQYRLPVLREELVASRYQLAVDRSLINAAFTAGIGQGIMVHYSGDQFRIGASFNDGIKTANTPWFVEDTEYSFTGRGEILFSGSWSQFDDFTSWKSEDTGFLLGVAAHYQDGEYGTASVETKVLELTADASVEFGGANLYGAFVWTDLDSEAGGVEANPWGALIQGGVFLNDQWEVFGRFEYGDDDDVSGTDSDDLVLLTVGVNDYISGHDLKWSTDVGYAFDGVVSFWGNSDAFQSGWRSSGEEDDQFVFRTQLQLLF